MKFKHIKNKLTVLLLLLSLMAVVVLGITSGVGIAVMRGISNDSATKLGAAANGSSSEALTNQIVSQLSSLADDKADIVDQMLLRSLGQTRLVASGMEKIMAKADKYLIGFDYNDMLSELPDLSVNYDPSVIGKYSVHVRSPREYLLDIVEEEVDGQPVIVSATLNYGKLISEGGFTVAEELYLASMLDNELANIKTFANSEGGYSGFSASYFCFEDSGIDVLGDVETMSMVEYDGRTRGWYADVKAAVAAGDLKSGDVYWTDPVPDGSGRGLAMICSAPVIVGGKLVGVAGSGGKITEFIDLVANTKLGDTGYSFMVHRDTSKVVINPDWENTNGDVAMEKLLNASANEEIKDLAAEIAKGASGSRTLTIDGKKTYAAYSPLDTNNWTMVTVIAADDPLITSPSEKLSGVIGGLTASAVENFNSLLSIFIGIFIGLIVLIIIAVIIFARIFSRRFTKPILELQEGANQISGGNLDIKLNVSTDDEIARLGESFNGMTSSLKEYIENLSAVTAEKERIGAELNVAKHIQKSMLPCIFPAFPDRKEFDIFASMEPAKEVGGDFYDMFLIDKDNLAVVIADVSGKGVPAALFMVIAKTLIKNHAQNGESPEEVFANTNAQLCENNDEGMFVTGWLGVLNIPTGRFKYVNAGHNPPLLKRKDGKFEYLKGRAGFVLAGMEGIVYKSQEITLNEGDALYLYTDGVTEATDSDNVLYGEERLKNALDANCELPVSDLLPAIKRDIDEFVGGAPQFDDITMLALKISPKEEA